MKEITRVSAGVMFESDVLRFIDRLAAEQHRNRSFTINQIIRLYARILHQQRQGAPTPPQPEPDRPVEAIQF